ERGRAAGVAVLAQVLAQRLAELGQVHAVVVEEARVLAGQHAGEQLGRDVGQGRPALHAREVLVRLLGLALAGVDERGAPRRPAGQSPGSLPRSRSSSPTPTRWARRCAPTRASTAWAGCASRW